MNKEIKTISDLEYSLTSVLNVPKSRYFIYKGEYLIVILIYKLHTDFPNDSLVKYLYYLSSCHTAYVIKEMSFIYYIKHNIKLNWSKIKQYFKGGIK